VKKNYIIIQGHTNYCDFLIEHYKNTDNVIWCTDEVTPLTDLNKIKDSNIHLETIPSVSSGYGNINLQVQTTLKGLKKAKELGATDALKIRSDMYFSDTQKFFDIMLNDKKIHQLTYVNHVPPHEYPHHLVSNTAEWITENELIVKNDNLYNYVTDFCNYGNIDEMILYWDYPFEESPLAVNAEIKLFINYVRKKEYEIDFSFEYMSEIYGFFLSKLRENKIQLNSLKHGYNMATLGTSGWENCYLG